jgi:hypothetical protein
LVEKLLSINHLRKSALFAPVPVAHQLAVQFLQLLESLRTATQAIQWLFCVAQTDGWWLIFS